MSSFSPSQTTESAPTQADVTGFPLPTTDSELVLIEVDPQCLHAYWHLADKPADVDLSLCLYAEDGTLVQTLAVSHAGQCYLDHLDSATQYQARLGGINAEGVWQEFARSNDVQLPTAPPQLAYAFPDFSAVSIDTTPTPVAAFHLLPEFPNSDGLQAEKPMMDRDMQRLSTEEILQRIQLNPHHSTPVHSISSTPKKPATPAIQALALEHFLGLSSHQCTADLALQAELQLSGTAPLNTEMYFFGTRLPQDAQGHFQLRLPIHPYHIPAWLKNPGDL